MGDHKIFAGSADGGSNGGGFVQIQRHRLFAKHVFTGLQKCNGLFGMIIVRRGHRNHIHIIHGQNFPVIVSNPYITDGVFIQAAVNFLLIRVAYCQQIILRTMAECHDMTDPFSHGNDSSTQFFAHFQLPFY